MSDNGYHHALKIQAPQRGTAVTLAAMKALVHGADFTQRVGRQAARLASRVEQFDRSGQVRAVYDFLRARVRFKADTYGVEVLRAPDQLLREIDRYGVTAADCDDIAMLGSALARAMGFRTGFVIYAETPRGKWVHVTYAVWMGGKWVPFDPQERIEPGKFPPHARKAVYPVD